ncbi:unnamed protein product [Chironomus riparius]|uniref:Uncharacterized protein n=1 Tax=Chironomus riparius TaxID=315576 RepID=A0A9P0JAP1_9DIPT|nr:unnamed protein product [Chironomus riparius]
MQLNHSLMTNFDCKYADYSHWKPDIIYTSIVKTDLNIDLPEKAYITGINGSHASGESNNNEVMLYSSGNKINYFPLALETFYKFFVRITLRLGRLVELRQSDMRNYTKLKYFDLTDNDIQVLENGIFDFNPNSEHVAFQTGFQSNKLVFIGQTVFDGLTNLVSLGLLFHPCISLHYDNDRNDVLDIINDVKVKYVDSKFSNLTAQLEKLELESKTLDSDIFMQSLTEFENDLKASKFAKLLTFTKKIEILNALKLEDLTSKSDVDLKNLNFKDLAKLIDDFKFRTLGYFRHLIDQASNMIVIMPSD